MRFIIYLFLLLFCACSLRTVNMNVSDYAQWVRDPENGLNKTKQLGDYIFSAQYKPREMVALLEFGKDADPSSSEFKTRVSNLGQMEYFTFTISTVKGLEVLSNNIANEGEFFGRLEYFLEHGQEAFSLIAGEDTLPCRFYHFERTYGLSPNTNILLGFENIGKCTSDIVIQYEDILLGVGPVNITYDIDDLKEIPKLK